jgi:hypothetical protein
MPEFTQKQCSYGTVSFAAYFKYGVYSTKRNPSEDMTSTLIFLTLVLPQSKKKETKR